MWRRNLESAQDLDSSGNKSPNQPGHQAAGICEVTATGRPLRFAEGSSCVAHADYRYMLHMHAWGRGAGGAPEAGSPHPLAQLGLGAGKRVFPPGGGLQPLSQGTSRPPGVLPRSGSLRAGKRPALARSSQRSEWLPRCHQTSRRLGQPSGFWDGVGGGVPRSPSRGASFLLRGFQ